MALQPHSTASTFLNPPSLSCLRLFICSFVCLESSSHNFLMSLPCSPLERIQPQSCLLILASLSQCLSLLGIRNRLLSPPWNMSSTSRDFACLPRARHGGHLAGKEGVRVRGSCQLVLLSLPALLTRTFTDHVMLFTQTKKQAHRMHILLGLMGLQVGELHGNLSQTQRLEALR